MVLIHQKLYNKDQLVGINTEEYIQDLTKDIFESHQSENKINYSLDVQPMVLDIESITPIGLILNELITNVLKHAFETITSESTMNIEFKKAGESIVMKVSDNGQGMASEIREGSFGIKLMKALAKKLKAVLTFEPEVPNGTLATLHINQFTEL
jgi:two-component sensor histidine kinase